MTPVPSIQFNSDSIFVSFTCHKKMWLKPFKNRYERERGSEASTSCPKFRKFVAERLLEMSERLGLVTSVIDLKFNDVGTYKFVVSDYETVILKEE